MRIRGRTKKQGLVFYERLNKNAVRSASNMPNLSQNPRGASTDHIPSKPMFSAKPSKSETARNTIMEKVRRGEIRGVDAVEIERRAKCLAPAYNKGAYQYVGSPEAAHDAGRKVNK